MIFDSFVKKMAGTKVKNILVSQPQPESGKSPYFDLAEKYKLKIDFRPFIQVEEVPGKIIRTTKKYPNNYDAIIFNSKTAIANFFRVCEELKIEMPNETKYFCISESIGVYLQKFIQLRKRKVFFGNGKLDDLIPLIQKHIEKNKEAKFLMPCSNINQGLFAAKLAEKEIQIDEAILYKTVASDLSDLTHIKYDIIVFYSPMGIKSLYENFPSFEQEDRAIAAFGNKTQTATKAAGLKPNIIAPAPGLPSMTMAIEAYIKKTMS